MGFDLIKTKIARYGIVGAITNLSGYGLFLAMLQTGLPPAVTSGITYLVIVAISYYAHRRWSFNSKTTHSKDAPRYIFAYLIGLVVAMVAMYILSAILKPAIAQLIVILVSAGSIYMTLEILRFGSAGKEDDT